MTAQRMRKPDNERIFSKKRLKMDYPLYVMMLIPLIFLIIFKYLPMAGIVVAFQKYLPAKGITGSKWVGLRNFQTLFTMPGFFNALRNTVIISVSEIILDIAVPVAFTLLLNEMSSSTVKRGVQTLVYLPHFISWVLLASVFLKLLGGNGIVNQFIQLLGGKPIIFLGDNRYFRWTMVVTHVWKGFGYGTIVYLAAITGCDPELYEAAAIDGAGRWKQMIHVTIPTILPIIMLMMCLSVGSILSAGFDQIFNMYNSVVYETGDILDTLVYRIGLGSSQFGISTAASLFKSVISCILVVASYKIAYKTTGYHVL